MRLIFISFISMLFVTVASWGSCFIQNGPPAKKIGNQWCRMSKCANRSINIKHHVNKHISTS